MNIEIRENELLIDGYANTVCRDSEILPSPFGNFVEQTTEGVWNEAIRTAENIDFLLNHDSNKKLGSTTEGTLELQEDSIGLRVLARINDRDVIESVRTHGVSGFSFGFRTLSDRWEDAKDGLKRRFLDKIDLREVSLLVGKNPAYRGCGVVAMRDAENNMIEHRSSDIEVSINDTYAEEKRLKEEEELRELDELKKTFELRKIKLGLQK